jgi:hypothetical protein
VKDQSHKDEMSAAIRGDFQRLRERGVAATLAPRDDEDAPEPVEITPEPDEHAVAVVATGFAEPDAEPEANEGDEPYADDRPGFLTRLFGR